MSVKLIDYLPENYKKSVPVVELQEVFDNEAKKVTNTATDMQKQLHLNTATWGLAAWEIMYGLAVDTTKNETTRRATIMARMGGTDTTRPITVKEVSEKFLQGKVAVFEVNAEYRFEVHFLEVLQQGQDIDDLKRVLEEIKPAHLAYTIILKYNTWGDLKNKCKTWQTVKTKTWGQRKGERIESLLQSTSGKRNGICVHETKETKGEMAITPNYHLNLPSLDDEADITKLNENFTKIDEVLKENENNHIAKKIIYTDNQQLNATNVQDAIDNVAIRAAKALEIAEKALETMDNLFYVIGVLPSQSGSLTYTGSVQSPTWDNYNSEKLTLGGTTSGTNAATYTATFTPKGKYKWSNGTQTPASVPWTIGRVVVALPTQSGSLRYTGSTLSPSWNNYDSQKLTLGGTTSAINVGTYTATFTPKDNYKWSDGSTTAKNVSWTIQNETITLPTQNGSLVYNGSGLSPKWNNYDSQKLTLGGTTDGIDAGTYTATFTPKAGYAWSDGSTSAKNVSWTIERAVVAVPAQSGSLKYTGSTLSPSWSNYDSQKLIPGGTTYAVNAGTYTATFTPKSNYKWSDGVTTAKIVYWNIAKAECNLSLSKTQISVNNVYGEKTVTVSRTGDGAIRATSQHSNIATCSVSGTTITIQPKTTGHTTITVSVADGTNHNAPENKKISVVSKVYNPTLSANSWAQIAEASATGKASTIWKVGDTKDIVINGKTFTFAIMGFDHDDLQSGGKAGITFGMKNAMDNKLDHGMNYSASNKGGFTGSAMYTFLQNTMFNSLPADLQSVIKMVNKKTATDGYSNHEIVTTAMKLFLFSEQEIFGSKIESYGNEGTQYKYFATAGNRIKENDAGDKSAWWQRSLGPGSRSFCFVDIKGEGDANNASYLYDICFGFCV